MWVEITNSTFSSKSVEYVKGISQGFFPDYKTDMDFTFKLDRKVIVTKFVRERERETVILSIYST